MPSRRFSFLARIWRCLSAKGPRYSLSYSFVCIFVSVLIFLPISLWITFPNFWAFKQTLTPIKTLFLTCIEPPHLPEPFFSELLQLSADKPAYLQTFSTKSAEHFLNSLGIFSFLSIEKVPDHKGLAIAYSVSPPLAFLGNKTHTLIGLEGKVFPSLPFFHSFKLPEVFVPEAALTQPQLPRHMLDIIKILIDNLQIDPSSIIDLSQIDNYPGEFVVRLASGGLLRFRKDSFLSGIQHYQRGLAQGAFSPEETAVYDLRCKDYLLLKRK